MIFVLILLITTVILIDFIKLEKKDKKVVYVYITIVSLALIVSIVDNYEFFGTSPLEFWIVRMKPITAWVEDLFK